MKSPGRLRVWRTEACRRRAGYAARRDAGKEYARSSYARSLTCECGEQFIARSPRQLRCGPCRPKLRAQQERARYAENREAVRLRMQEARRQQTEAQRLRAAEARQAWKRRVGRVESTVAAEQRRRARLQGRRIEKFKPTDVFARDGWVCGICHEAIDRALRYPHPMSVSVDHVLPIAAGGEHTMDNTRAAHLECNVRRGARS